MKNYLFVLAVQFLSLVIAASGAESIVDFTTTFSQREQDDGEVILQQEFSPEQQWYGRRHIHSFRPVPKADEIMQLGTCEYTADGVVLSTSEKLREYRNNEGKEVMFSNSIQKVIPTVPELLGKNLKAVFSIRGSGEVELNLIFQGKKDDPEFKGKNSCVRGNASSGVFTITGRVPERCQNLVLSCRINGPGKIVIKDVKMQICPDKTDFDVLETAMGYLDEKFYLPAETPFPLAFMLKRNPAKRIKKAVLLVQLPEGIRLLGSENRLPFIDEENGLCRFDATKAINSFTADDFFSWYVYQVFVTSGRRPEAEPVTLKYWLEGDGQKSQERQLSVYTVPPVTVTPPAKYMSYLEPVYHSGQYTPAIAQAMTALLRQNGFNGISIVNSEAYAAELSRHGMKRMAQIWQIRDGYVKGTSPIFEDLTGKQFGNLICPEEVIQRGKGYTDDALVQLQNLFAEKKFDFYYVNWEVYQYDYKGCFCSRCRDAFIRFAGLPRAEVEAAWPGQVIAKWHDLWCSFRSHQHGLICRTLEEDIHAIGKAAGMDNVHFMPQISAASFSDSFGQQYHPRDYFKEMQYVNVWGPYTSVAGLRSAYTYIPARYMQHYFQTKEMMAMANRLAPKLKITGLPYGTHANRCSSPEGIAMETLSCFVNGFAGSGVYWFDVDYRYWLSMAQANRIIATYENIPGVWQKTETVKVTPVTETLTTPYWIPYFTAYNFYPEMKTAPYSVVSRAWQQDGRFFAAIGNFWEKAPVFCSVQIPGLNGKYLLQQPHAGKYMRTTGKELAQGVLLEIAPLTWDFCLIEPDGGKADGKEFTPALVRTAMQASLPLIQAEMAEEKKRFEDISSLTVFSRWNFAEQPQIQAEKITLSEEPGNQDQILKIETPSYTAKLNPEKSGALISLLWNGQEQIAAATLALSGRAAFIKPVDLVLDLPMRIVDLRGEKDYVSAVLERPLWHGMRVRLIWQFYENQITERAEITNLTDKEMDLHFRFHNMFNFLGGAGGQSVAFTMGGQEFRTEPESRFFLAGDDKPEVPAFRTKPLRCPAGPVKFASLEFTSPEPVHGYFFWNTLAAFCGSFEPLFMNTVLAPGQTGSYSQTWK